MIESISNACHSVINHKSMYTHPARAIIRCHDDSCPTSLPEVKQCIFRWYLSCPSVVRIVGVFYQVYNIVNDQQQLLGYCWWSTSVTTTSMHHIGTTISLNDMRARRMYESFMTCDWHALVQYMHLCIFNHWSTRCSNGLHYLVLHFPARPLLGMIDKPLVQLAYSHWFFRFTRCIPTPWIFSFSCFWYVSYLDNLLRAPLLSWGSFDFSMSLTFL